MTNNKYDTECKNVTAVNGSCGEPSFKFGLTYELLEIEFNNLKKIFEFCKTSDKIINIHIILGATQNLTSDFEIDDNSILLFFDPNKAEYIDAPETINTDSSRKEFYFNIPFPLNYLKKSKEILDVIIQINKTKPVFITNRMCGTCHRSLYYLVQNGVKYIVNPEQGLDETMDPEDIRDCFDPSKYKYYRFNKSKIYMTKIKSNEDDDDDDDDDDDEGTFWYKK